jgi:ribonuclease HI
MRSTPVDALNSFAALPPVHILLNEVCQKAAIRLASAPTSHPLHKAVLKCSRGRKRHAPPLQLILALLNRNPREIEKWTPRNETRTLAPTRARTFPSRKSAIATERLDNSHIRVYADGSRGQEGVASAAVLYEGGRQKSAIGHRLGDHGDRSILEAELAAILLALQLILLAPVVDDATIYTDSQLALRSIDGQSVGAPRALVVATRRALNKARNHVGGTEIALRWCPGHAGSGGNEMADEEAKAAARGRQYPQNRIPIFLREYRPLADATQIKLTLHTENIHMADTLWSTSHTSAKLSERYRNLKASSFLDLTAGLNRSRATLLFRLITGHVALGEHLARIKCTEDNICSNCHTAPETVAHFLLRDTNTSVPKAETTYH